MKQSELDKAVKLLSKMRNEREQMEERETREARELKPPYLETATVVFGLIAIALVFILVIIS